MFCVGFAYCMRIASVPTCVWRIAKAVSAVKGQAKPKLRAPQTFSPAPLFFPNRACIVIAMTTLAFLAVMTFALAAVPSLRPALLLLTRR